jgi:hypothetical protein
VKEETCPFCGSDAIQPAKVIMVRKGKRFVSEAVLMECRNVDCMRSWTPRETVIFT